MRSLRQWVTFAILTLGTVSAPSVLAEPGYGGPQNRFQQGNGFGQGNGYGPGFGTGYGPLPQQAPIGAPGINPALVNPVVRQPFGPVAGPIGGPRGPITPGGPIGPGVPPPLVVAEREMMLMRQLVLHTENLGNQIEELNQTIAQATPFRSVIAPPVLEQMMRDPYINILVRTTLTATPPRISRAPFGSPWHFKPEWRRQSVEYMVAWRTHDVQFGALDWTNFPTPLNMGVTINRAAVMLPAVMFYLEAMRLSYVATPMVWGPTMDPRAAWVTPIAERLVFINAQLNVVRGLLEAIYCNDFFRPFFPREWAPMEPAFGPFTVNIMHGPAEFSPIPMFTFYPEGFPQVGLVQPNMRMAPRENFNPVLPYDPSQWQGPVAGNSPQYLERNPIQPGGPAMIPGMGDPSAAPRAQVPVMRNGVGQPLLGTGAPIHPGRPGANGGPGPGQGQPPIQGGPQGGNGPQGAVGPQQQVGGQGYDPQQQFAQQPQQGGGYAYGGQGQGYDQQYQQQQQGQQGYYDQSYQQQQGGYQQQGYQQQQGGQNAGSQGEFQWGGFDGQQPQQGQQQQQAGQQQQQQPGQQPLR